MSQVGVFPGMSNFQLLRSPTNPLDKSTVVSIYPKKIDERKPTLQPGRFVVPAGSRNDPGILVVGTSSWWKSNNLDDTILEIPQSSIQVADSIVRDYANGLLACDLAESMPGLFYVPGEFTVDEILEEQVTRLDAAVNKQRNWYHTLVRMADTLWARSNGNPLSISDDMRLAAQELQLKDKPWIKDFTTMQLVNCPACGQLRDEQYPVCQHCHTIIDKTKYDLAGFTKAV